MHHRTRRSSLLVSLAFVIACGPSTPGAESTGTSETSAAGTDTTDSVPTSTDTPDTSDTIDPSTPTDATDSDPTEVPADVCGECGTIFDGDVSPSGFAQIDGFIVATERLLHAVLTVEHDFREDMLALADVYGIAPGEVNADFVAQLIASIKADVADNAAGGLQPWHVAGQCRSAIDVAVDAVQRCEFKAACDPVLPQQRPPVACVGTCLGACSGECLGPLACVVPAAGVACEGACDGACTTIPPAACAGLCYGECEGACSLSDANGQCVGRCEGACSGNCVQSAPAPCDGLCHGSCLVDPGSAQCTGATTCRGACEGECLDDCLGEVSPPGTAGCAATPGCRPQAASLASASLECDAPTLELRFTFDNGLDAQARGAFAARVRTLETRGTAILQQTALLGVLITGEQDGESVLVPPPLSSLNVALQGLLASGVGELPVPGGRLVCVEPALAAAISALAGTAGSLGGVMEAQAMFAAFITTGQ